MDRFAYLHFPEWLSNDYSLLDPSTKVMLANVMVQLGLACLLSTILWLHLNNICPGKLNHALMCTWDLNNSHSNHWAMLKADKNPVFAIPFMSPPCHFLLYKFQYSIPHLQNSVFNKHRDYLKSSEYVPAYRLSNHFNIAHIKVRY